MKSQPRHKNYKCKKCNVQEEKWFDLGEEIPETILCSCGGEMAPWNIKDNKQRVFIFDSSK